MSTKADVHRNRRVDFYLVEVLENFLLDGSKECFGCAGRSGGLVTGS